MKISARLAGVTGVATVAATAASILLGAGVGHAAPGFDHQPGPGKITTTVTAVPSYLAGCYSRALNETVLVRSPKVDPDAEHGVTLVVSPLEPGTYTVSVFCGVEGVSELMLDETSGIVVTEATPTTPNPWGSLGDIGTGSLGG